MKLHRITWATCRLADWTVVDGIQLDKHPLTDRRRAHTQTLSAGRVTLQAMSQVRENMTGMKLVTNGLCLPPSSLLRTYTCNTGNTCPHTHQCFIYWITVDYGFKFKTETAQSVDKHTSTESMTSESLLGHLACLPVSIWSLQLLDYIQSCNRCDCQQLKIWHLD